MFKLLKKNKMAFEKFEDANKYIVENGIIFIYGGTINKHKK